LRWAVDFMQKGQYALDIGGSTAILVGATGPPESLTLRVCHQWDISPGAVEAGEIVEPELFAQDIRPLVLRHSLRGRRVHLAVSNKKVVVRTVDMPDLPEDEVLSAVQLQAQEYIPIPIEDTVLDAQLLRRVTDADGATHQEVLLVAAQKNMIMSHVNAVRRAGLRVASIDVSSLALVRALMPRTDELDADLPRVVCRALVDVSTSSTTFAVVHDKILAFSRSIDFSSRRFAHTLVEGGTVSAPDASMLVEHVGLSGSCPTQGDPYRREVILAAQNRLAQVADEIGEEVARSVEYYQSRQRSVPVDEIVLSGHGALVRNFDAYLAGRLGVPVSVADPLVHIAENATDISDSDLASCAPMLSVAVGLLLPERE
jgi:type IV pilus assembly protein PilM